jgi:5-formyltetrahydrofolate cyclo-ligase
VNKSQIRNKILKLRKKNNFKNLEIDFRNILQILKKEKINGKTVGGYYPYNYEADVIKILKKFEKINYFITLPKIKKNSQMDFFCWKTKDPLTINKYGIPEPTSNKIKYPDILLVPIVAFDINSNRVGYGGGYYDRYIQNNKKNKKIITIGLAYSFQKVKKITINKHDSKLDFIVTEKRK